MRKKLMSESMFKGEVNLLSAKDLKGFLLDNGAIESYIEDHYILKGDDPNSIYRTAEQTYKIIKGYEVIEDMLYVKLKLLEGLNNGYKD